MTKPILTDTESDEEVLSAIASKQPEAGNLEKFSIYPEITQSLRNYQQELALPGLTGQNYIICAPTGTGKTTVAGLIISDHLQRRKGLGKVLFLVNKVPLASQQKKALGSMIQGARIEVITGEVSGAAFHGSFSGDTRARKHIVSLSADVLVCTAGCVLNELTKKSLEITDVSLVVIDECHHTHKNSDYAKIMGIYLREKKQNSSTLDLPQIVGLTATPGAGDSFQPDLMNTLDHLITLCAYMDATGGIKTVTKNAAELQAFAKKSEFHLAVLKGRDEHEQIVTLVSAVMAELEKMLGLSCTYSKWSQQYNTWASLKKSDLQKAPNSTSRDKISTIELLQCLSKSLNVYMDLSYDDALEVLEAFPSLPDSSSTKREKQLSEVLRQLKLKLSTLPRPVNPLLKGIEAILSKQFSQNPSSKAIIFVHTKVQATSIHRWISTNPSLSIGIRPSVVTGQTRDTGLKMTKVEQTDTIKGFHTGDHNLLVTTSVLEEGLDVPACNLVIRYQHVTNEISKVQTQGRARAANSQGFTIISSGSSMQYQDMLNDERIAVVEEAITYLPSPGELFTRKLAQKQDFILQSLSLQEQSAVTRQHQYSPYEVNLLCKRCTTFACNASDVCQFGSCSQYIVDDKDFEKRLSIRAHRKPTTVPRGMSRIHKIHCSKCNQEWGVIGRWWKDSRELPVLKCCNFFFQIDGHLCTFNKWSHVPFPVSVLPTCC